MTGYRFLNIFLVSDQDKPCQDWFRQISHLANQSQINWIFPSLFKSFTCWWQARSSLGRNDASCRKPTGRPSECSHPDWGELSSWDPSHKAVWAQALPSCLTESTPENEHQVRVVLPEKGNTDRFYVALGSHFDRVFHTWQIPLQSAQTKERSIKSHIWEATKWKQTEF